MAASVLAVWECSWEHPFGDEVEALVPVRLVRVIGPKEDDGDGDADAARGRRDE